MSSSILSAGAVARALSIRDLTDPAQGAHAMQRLIAECVARLTTHWRCTAVIRRASPIVSIADNYDRLGYPPDAVARDARYTRYVCDVAMLRSQTSAMIPPLLGAHDDALLVCPGIVYRRDAIDRLHTGEPHQLDLWRVSSRPTSIEALETMIALVVETALPGWDHRVVPAEHPYTTDGLQIDVRGPGDRWIEIGECGRIHPALGRHGLAMGLGLDRLVMLRKGLNDIRLLRATDSRISKQMLDLSPYRAISAQPAIRRDLSIVVAAETTAEDLGDRVRAALKDRADAIEAIEVIAETPYAELPSRARQRLAMTPAQKNVLLRVVLRELTRTLTHAEGNELRNAIYAAVHQGAVEEWA